MEDAAAAIGAAFGSQHIAAEAAKALRDLLPGLLFLRASVRCGTGLFVSQDLLQAGSNELSVVSLKNSLAGVAMAQGRTVVVAAPATSQAAPSAAQVLCVPVAVAPATAGGSGRGAPPEAAAAASAATSTAAAASGAQYRPIYVGALMAGVADGGGAPPQLWERLQALAEAAPPYFLLLGLTKAADMAEMLKLRAADCSCCAEDELQDMPLSACTPRSVSPGGGGGSGGGAQAEAGGGCGAAKKAAEAEQAQTLHAAAVAALSQRSGLTLGSAGPAAAPAAAAAEAAADAPSSSGGGGLKGAPLQGLPPGAAAAAAAEAEAEAEDPKAQLKRRQAAAGTAAVASAAARPPPPAGALLRYADGALEARFAAAHNASLRRGDLLFSLMHLSVALCFAVLQPGAALRSAAAQAFVAALAAPLAVMALDASRYTRHREALLASLLLAHALLLRWSGAAQAAPPPPGAAQALPWLLRTSGAEAVAVFSLGFKLRFCLFLPVQALCLSVLLAPLAAACPAALGAQAGACLLAGQGGPGMALLLALVGLLPAAAVYKFEARARRRFEQATAAQEEVAA